MTEKVYSLKQYYFMNENSRYEEKLCSYTSNYMHVIVGQLISHHIVLAFAISPFDAMYLNTLFASSFKFLTVFSMLLLEVPVVVSSAYNIMMSSL